MESLNGHEAGNGGHGQGDSYGNSPFLDPTAFDAAVIEDRKYNIAKPSHLREYHRNVTVNKYIERGKAKWRGGLWLVVFDR